MIGHHDGVTITPSANAKAWIRRVGRAVYVLSIDTENNRVVVGEDDALRTSIFEIENVNGSRSQNLPRPCALK